MCRFDDATIGGPAHPAKRSGGRVDLSRIVTGVRRQIIKGFHPFDIRRAVDKGVQQGLVSGPVDHEHALPRFRDSRDICENMEIAAPPMGHFPGPCRIVGAAHLGEQEVEVVQVTRGL